jgi:transposase
MSTSAVSSEANVFGGGVRDSASPTNQERELGMGSTIGKDEEILKLYAGGATMQEIGDKFGVSRQMVCQVLQKHNVKGDKSRRGRRPIAAEVIDGYVAEAVRTGSKQAAAEKFGVSVDAITRALRKRGVSMRKDKYTTEAVKSDITSRYLKGERLRVIAESYGTRAQHINTLLRKWGVQPQGWHRGGTTKGSLKIHQG